MFLLPLSNPGTTKITDGSKTCDVYSPSAPSQQATQVDRFIRFTEFWLNKIKRKNPPSHWVMKNNFYIYTYCMAKKKFLQF